MEIELLDWPTWAPNLPLIEKWWKLVKKPCPCSTSSPVSESLQRVILPRIAQTAFQHKDALERLLTPRVQTFQEVSIIGEQHTLSQGSKKNDLSRPHRVYFYRRNDRISRGAVEVVEVKVADGRTTRCAILPSRLTAGACEDERQYETSAHAEQEQTTPEPEPRWPVVVALLAVSGLYAALPASLAVIPHWYLLMIVFALFVPTHLAHYRGHHNLNQRLGYVVNGVVTAAMMGSLALLIRALPTRDETPVQLLWSAASLWITNILVFALWYWRLDAGGPNHRDQRVGHPNGAFLFPQMTSQDALAPEEAPAWSPNFVDYLFLAFNTSTALSPTDVPVLSRWAKLLMMVQAVISLTVIVVLAARAINIL